MEIGFEQIKDMTIGQLLKIAQDKERLEKEMDHLKRKYPMAQTQQFKREDFSAEELIAKC